MKALYKCHKCGEEVMVNSMGDMHFKIPACPKCKKRPKKGLRPMQQKEVYA